MPPCILQKGTVHAFCDPNSRIPPLSLEKWRGGACDCCPSVGSLTAASFAFPLSGQIITVTALLHGCTATVDWSEQAYPPTVNAAPLVSMVEEVAGKLVGDGEGGGKLVWQRIVEPSMAAEDFSFLAGIWVSPCLFRRQLLHPHCT